MKRVNIVTLGCSKNVVDSEHIAAQAADAGYKIDFDSESTDAKIVVINTCGFIGDAKQESIDTILSFADAKARGDIEQLFVIGCLSERYADDLRDEIPEVDSYFGARDLTEVLTALGITYDTKRQTERLLTTPKHYAYLKISEGCNWKCSYCAIPLIRGSHVSVPMEVLEQEARELAKKGVKELLVIGQDTTFYGMDLYGKRTLAELLERLCKIEGIEWIRLHYAYPTAFPDDVIEVMAREEKICKYLDIPLQHISTRILKSMKRGIDSEGTYALVERLRAAMPDIAIRTTLIAGYPGETEQEFEELIAFVSRCRFERLGVFAYSHEEGTWAGENLEDDISEEEKERRVAKIMKVQNEISYQLNALRVATTQQVIIDSFDGDNYVGRTRYDSPEVDGEVFVSSPKKLKAGTICTVKIDSGEDYDLFGRLDK